MMRLRDLIIGKVGRKMLTLPGGEHVVLHARTGAGKGVSFVIPNCFAWPGSLIVLDIKGEAWQATAGYREHVLGQAVYRFDPAAADGRSHRWDPFAAIERRSLNRFRQIQRQANLLFPEHDQVGTAGNGQKFWDDAGRQTFTAVATLLAELPEQPLTMANIARVFQRADGFDWLMAQVKRRRESDEVPLSQIAADGIADYVGGDPKLRNEIRTTVSTRLQTWMDPQIAAVTASSDFDLRHLRQRPMTIYVVIQPGNIPRLRPLLRLFFDAAINLNTDRTPEQDPSLTMQTLFLMDEFARLGRTDTIAHALQYVRGYGIRMALVVQNKAQVRAIYGKDGSADIFDNVGAEIVFGSADPELTEELEKRLGDATMNIITQNRPRFWSSLKWSKHGESEHPHRRPLMLDQEIAQMSPDEQLVIRPGMRPMKTKRICWYRDPMFRQRVYPEPHVGQLLVESLPDDGLSAVAGSQFQTLSALIASLQKPAG